LVSVTVTEVGPVLVEMADDQDTSIVAPLAVEEQLGPVIVYETAMVDADGCVL